MCIGLQKTRYVFMFWNGNQLYTEPKIDLTEAINIETMGPEALFAHGC